MSRYYIVGLFFLFSFPLSAQYIRVFNKLTNQPVEDVLIYTQDQKKFTNTDSLGGFGLNIFPDNSELILQHFKTLKKADTTAGTCKQN